MEQRNDSGGTSQHIPTSNPWPSTHLRGIISVADLRACFPPRLGNSKEPLLNGLIIFKYPPNQLIPPGLPGPPHLNLCLSAFSAFSAGDPNCTMVFTQEPGQNCLSWGRQPPSRSSRSHAICSCLVCTIWLFNIAMENDPFIDGFPIKNCDFP